jgi:hypothetical protein
LSDCGLQAVNYIAVALFCGTQCLKIDGPVSDAQCLKIDSTVPDAQCLKIDGPVPDAQCLKIDSIVPDAQCLKLALFLMPGNLTPRHPSLK